MSRRHFFEEETMDREISNKILYKWMGTYLRKNKLWTFISLSILIFVFTSLLTVVTLIQGNIIDFGISLGDWSYVLNWVFIWSMFFIVSNVGTLFVNYYLGKLGQKIIFDIRNDLFSHLQSMSQSYFDKKHSGDIISISTNDVDQLAFVFGGQLTQIISDVFRMLLIIVMMFMVNVELSLISILIIPIFLLAARLFTSKAKKAFKKVRQTMGDVTQKTEENISGIKTIKAYGKESQAESEFDEVNIATRKIMLKTRKIFSLYFPIIMFISQFFTAVVLLYSGYALLNGVSIFGTVITFGNLQVFNSFLTQLFYPIFTITMFQQVIQSALAASERIYTLLKEDVDIPDPEEPVDFEAVNIKGEIEFKNVTFSYSERGTEPVFQPQMMLNHGGRMPDMKNMPPQAKEMMKKFMKNPNDMPPEANARIENFMKNKNEQPMNPFMQMMQNPDQILKMAQNLDSKLKGQSSSSMMSGGGQSQMGSGGSSMGKRGGMPDEMVLNILSNPMISDEIKEQFSPTVKATIKEHIKIQANLTQKGAVIKNLSLKIPAGETVAIVGETGAGKTTLIKLLARFYDIQEGEILIDGINIKKTRKADLRSNIGMVPQDSFLFSGDILSNLFYGFPNGKNRYEVTDKLLEISKFLGLHNFIETMPDGYNTYLLENASNLSVGQRQLIAFARVLMLDPKILVLDEATSSVDPYTESLIQDALEKAKKGRTTIIIAHRLSTIKNAGLIIVLDDGRIIEMGTHDELLTKKGKYAQLVDMQSKDIN